MTFTASAFYDMWKDAAAPQGFRASLVVATPELAKEIAASFPKFVKVKGQRYLDRDGTIKGYVSFHLGLSADRVTGAVNETGLKRLRKFLGLVEIEWLANSQNSYPTLAAFTAALEA